MDPKKCPMPTQDPNVRNKNFEEVALGYTAEMAVNEAKRCVHCKNKPCQTGCPVGHHTQLVAAGLELVLEDEQVFAAETDHAVHHAALLVQFTGDGQSDGAAHAAADHADLFQALHLCGAAQGAHKIVAALAPLEAVQLHGGAAHDLENDIHSALFAVVTGHGQGDALAVLKRAHNDKLARLCFFGNERGFNDHLCHGGVQRDFLSDLIHCVCSFFWQDLGA